MKVSNSMAAVASALEEFDELIKEKVEQRWTHKEISSYLISEYGDIRVRGLSTRSVQRYCVKKGIHKTSRLNDEDLDVAVMNATAKVIRYRTYIIVFI